MTLYTAVLQMVRMRHRQLGAHEVGHTLGLAHNFMGSVACAGSNADRATGRGGSCICSTSRIERASVSLDLSLNHIASHACTRVHMHVHVHYIMKGGGTNTRT